MSNWNMRTLAQIASQSLHHISRYGVKAGPRPGTLVIDPPDPVPDSIQGFQAGQGPAFGLDNINSTPYSLPAVYHPAAAMARPKRKSKKDNEGAGSRRPGRPERRRHRKPFRILFIPLDRLFREWASITLF